MLIYLTKGIVQPKTKLLSSFTTCMTYFLLLFVHIVKVNGFQNNIFIVCTKTHFSKHFLLFTGLEQNGGQLSINYIVQSVKFHLLEDRDVLLTNTLRNFFEKGKSASGEESSSEELNSKSGLMPPTIWLCP